MAGPAIPSAVSLQLFDDEAVVSGKGGGVQLLGLLDGDAQHLGIEPACKTLKAGMLLALKGGDGNVGTIFYCFHKLNNTGRIVLAVIIHVHENIAVYVLESGHFGRCLTKVFGQIHSGDFFIIVCQSGDGTPGLALIGGTVIDQNDLVIVTGMTGEFTSQIIYYGGDGPGGFVTGNCDGDKHGSASEQITKYVLSEIFGGKLEIRC